MAHSATSLTATASHRLDKIICNQLPWFHPLSTTYQQIGENTRGSLATTAICPLFHSLDACLSLKTKHRQGPKHRQEAALSRFHSSREKRPTFYPFSFTKTARSSAATTRLTTSWRTPSSMLIPCECKRQKWQLAHRRTRKSHRLPSSSIRTSQEGRASPACSQHSNCQYRLCTPKAMQCTLPTINSSNQIIMECNQQSKRKLNLNKQMFLLRTWRKRLASTIKVLVDGWASDVAGVSTFVFKALRRAWSKDSHD